MMSDSILDKIDAYYSGKLREHGPTPRGVDWNSVESQEIRFAQLARLLPEDSGYSLIDYGCGYGAFADFLQPRQARASYVGFDVSEAMIREARSLHEGSAAAFTDRAENLQPCDYVVASGIFSVKMDVREADWKAYIETTIETMNALSRRGFAFNLLTAYSDPDRMRPDLFYARPSEYFERCMAYSKWVALLHDYGLYEFTLLVRKD